VGKTLEEMGSLRVACALLELLHGALQVSPSPTKCSVRLMHPESTMVARPAATASSRIQWVVIASCALLLVLPLGIFQYFPSQDGPAHVNAALALANLTKGTTTLANYFVKGPFPLTNWAATVVLSALRHIVAPTRIESTFVFFYIALMTTGIIITVRYLFRCPPGYALAFFPLAFSHMLHMGSFNLALAYVPFLPLLGLCHRYLLHPSMRLVTLISLTLLLTFTLHVQMALICLGCLGVYITWFLAFGLVRNTRFLQSSGLCEVSPTLRLTDCFMLILACVPVLVMCVLYLEVSGIESSHPLYAGLLMKFAHLVFLSGVASYSIFGMGVSVLIFALLAVSVWIAMHEMLCPMRLAPADCMLGCSLFILGLFLVLPNGLGNVFNIEERLMIPMLLSLIGWAIIRITPRFSPEHVALLALGLVTLQTIDRTLGFEQINRDLNEYAEVGSYVPGHSAIITINLDQVAAARKLHRSLAHPFEVTTRFDPERAFMGTVLKDRDVAFVSNYEALYFPLFALKYRDWLSTIVGGRAFDIIAADQADNASLERLIEKLRTGPAPISYLAIWVMDPASVDDPKAQAVLEVIDRNYRKIFTSSSAHMLLYQLK
jgi:hypothetical protein